MKCDICGNNLPRNFKFILIHNATHEDFKQGAFSDVDKEIKCCDACILKLNFREYPEVI